jgi:hypothetical protein
MQFTTQEGTLKMGKIGRSFEPQELIDKFVLRLPNRYNEILNQLVDKGAAKSKNELIAQIISCFLSDLRTKAEAELKK